MFKKLAVAIAAVGLVAVAAATAADFSVNPTRVDPYKQFKFRVKWDGKYISGVTKVSGLHRYTEVVTSFAGGVATKTPGKTVYQPITLERGRTHDNEFENWAKTIHSMSASAATPTGFRKDMLIDLYNEAGQRVMSWKVYKCWPSKYSALKEFNANRTEVAVESIELACDGFERDTEVTEPLEPTRP